MTALQRVKTITKCVCISAFGSCRRRRCESKVPPLSVIGDALIESLLKSRRIKRSNALSNSKVTCVRQINERNMRKRLGKLFFIDILVNLDNIFVFF